MKIGIKYCGGCNPNYDRVALAQHIQKQLEGYVTFVSPHTNDMDIVLVLHGCPTACADITPFQNVTVWSITDPEDAEAFITHVKTAAKR